MWNPFDTIARWWRGWRLVRGNMDRLGCCGSVETERIAQDVGVSPSELRALAGRWPDAADQLNRRLAALGFDRSEIRTSEPQVMHDLQRVCTLCAQARQCERDLASHPNDPYWREYCPNVMTLDALAAERKRATKVN